MSERSLARTAPLSGSAPWLRPLPPAARFILRGPPAVMDIAGAVWGVSLSRQACRAAQRGPYAALWLGPDEQLLLTPEEDGVNFAGLLAARLAGIAHSLVDVSHRQSALVLDEPYAAAALNAGCPLDLDLEVFPVGACTRTVLAKAPIVLWRPTLSTFHLEVWRSFSSYVQQFLEQARNDLTPGEL